MYDGDGVILFKRWELAGRELKRTRVGVSHMTASDKPRAPPSLLARPKATIH